MRAIELPLAHRVCAFKQLLDRLAHEGAHKKTMNAR